MIVKIYHQETKQNPESLIECDEMQKNVVEKKLMLWFYKGRRLIALKELSDHVTVYVMNNKGDTVETFHRDKNGDVFSNKIR